MSISGVTVARPYAEAAFKFASDRKEFSLWSEVLDALAQCSEDPAFRRMCMSPGIQREARLEAVLQMLGGSSLNSHLHNFLGLMNRKSRLMVAREISREFERLRREHENVVSVVVYTAYELPENERNQLSEAIGRRLGKQLQVQVELMPELIGGVRIHVGDDVIDASVRGDLDRLADTLRN